MFRSLSTRASLIIIIIIIIFFATNFVSIFSSKMGNLPFPSHSPKPFQYLYKVARKMREGKRPIAGREQIGGGKKSIICKHVSKRLSVWYTNLYFNCRLFSRPVQKGNENCTGGNGSIGTNDVIWFCFFIFLHLFSPFLSLNHFMYVKNFFLVCVM